MPLLPFRLWTTPRATADLHARLDAARWPLVPFHDSPTGDAGRSTDAPIGVDDLRLRELVRRWRFSFEWAAVLRDWNRYAHIRGPVAGEGSLELHALLAAPDASTPAAAASPAAGGGGGERLAVLVLPAWPQSFAQYLALTDRLTAAGHEVVVPSLPGTGFADSPRAATWGSGETAQHLAQLMRVLGYRRYAIHAAPDTARLAALIASAVASGTAGGHVTGIHIAGDATTAARLGAARQEPAALAYALHDSPLGLLAWLLPPCAAAGMDDEEIVTLATLHWMTGAARGGLRAMAEVEPVTSVAAWAEALPPETPTRWLGTIPGESPEAATARTLATDGAGDAGGAGQDRASDLLAFLTICG